MYARHELGRTGEQTATRYLEKQGYQIVTVSELKEIQKLRNEKQNR